LGEGTRDYFRWAVGSGNPTRKAENNNKLYNEMNQTLYMSNYKIRGMDEPEKKDDAATKSYVDNVVESLITAVNESNNFEELKEKLMVSLFTE
jgi:hypothetical protein